MAVGIGVSVAVAVGSGVAVSVGNGVLVIVAVGTGVGVMVAVAVGTPARQNPAAKMRVHGTRPGGSSREMMAAKSAAVPTATNAPNPIVAERPPRRASATAAAP